MAAAALRSAIRVGIVGARGHTGAELIKLVSAHPHMEMVLPSDRRCTADEVVAVAPDLVFLALPNNVCAPYVAALNDATTASGRPPVLVDLSADYRFDDSGAWKYGLPERRGAREALTGANLISNPGCYATGAQVALLPLMDAGELDPERPPHIFGVSGYSGAGTAPSDKNDPDKLRDNIMPYALAGHIHEREVGRQLGQDVRFMPHVGAHFRGISLTVSADLQSATTPEAVHALFAEYYAGEPLVEVAAVGEYPHVQDVTHKHHVGVGGFTVDASGRRVVICSAIDNLLKGAATQAMQNANLAFGLDELLGIAVPQQAGEEEQG